MRPFARPEVAAKFASYPPAVRRRMLALRELVFRTAAAATPAGPIEESLKWGEPAYVTPSGAGSTVRIDWNSKAPDVVALYFNCNTNLVQTFCTLSPKELRFEGNRAIVLGLNEALPREALAYCLHAAFTYHLEKPARGRMAGGTR